MNYKKLSVFISVAALAFMAAGPVSAVTLRLDTSTRVKAEAQIDARIAALRALQARIDQMQKINDSGKASLNGALEASLADMAALKAKIAADTDDAALKADVQSLTKSYRIYFLILPKARISAAADRIMVIANLMNELSVRLQARITAAGQAGMDVKALNANLADMNAKSADGNLQAQTALNTIVNLQPDNSDKTVFAANLAALKNAWSKIRLAINDLKTAREDAGMIVKALGSAKAQ